MVNRRSGKFYRKNEAEVMERLGLVPTKNSGAGWLEKEDGYNDFLLCQLKSTDAESIRISLLDIHKLEYHAITEHKLPVFAIQFLQTGELFLMAKPADLPSVVEYINTGKCDIVPSSVDISETTPVETKVIKSSSAAREAFQKEREEKYQNGRNNKSKSSR